MTAEYYQEKISKTNVELKKANSISKILLTLKLLFFIAGVSIVIIAIYSNSYLTTYYIVAGVLFAFYLSFVKIDSNHSRKITYFKALLKVYNNELLGLKYDFSNFEAGSEFINPIHEYSFDLDIFGEQSFFHRINRTVTLEGKRKLAKKLTELPKDKADILKTQSAISELEDNDSFRHSFQAIGSLLNKELSFYIHHFTSSNIEQLLIKKYIYIAAFISISILIFTALFASFNLIPIWIPFIVFFIQLISPVILFKNMTKYSAEIGRLHKNMNEYINLIKLLEGINFETELNQNLRNSLFHPANSLMAFKKLASILNQFDKRENAYALIILNGFFLNDIFLLIKYCNWKNKYLNKLEVWIDILAEFEVLISFANANFNFPSYTIPHFNVSGDTILEAKELGHPFIDERKLVTNNFEIRKNTFSIITGANMAGKSTLLRSLGISYIMALNGMKVCAKQYKVQIVKLFSSMRNADNLTLGVSYFSAELIRIEQLINYIMDNNGTLIILDEILKGTNSKDKLNGSIMFLNKIQKLPVSGVIATHDLALSELEHINPKTYLNYCFEINLQTTQMYSYKIQKGVCKNLNATFLLNNIFNKVQEKVN